MDKGKTERREEKTLQGMRHKAEFDEFSTVEIPRDELKLYIIVSENEIVFHLSMNM